MKCAHELLGADGDPLCGLDEPATVCIRSKGLTYSDCERFEEKWGTSTVFSVQVSEKMAAHLVEMYAKGNTTASLDGERSEGMVELGAVDNVQLITALANIIAHLTGSNKDLAENVMDLVKGMVDEDKSPGEIAQALRSKVPEFLDGEAISIQRPDEEPLTFTPKQYAKMLASTISNTVRNEGYIQKMQNMGVADGWLWDGIEDGSTCDQCKKQIRDRRVRSWDEPRPPLTSHIGECRCRPISHIDNGKKEALKKRVADLRAQAEEESKTTSASGTLKEMKGPQEKASVGWRTRAKRWLER